MPNRGSFQRFLTVILLVLVLVAFQARDAYGQKSAVITGFVLDEESKPIPKATITVLGPQGPWTENLFRASSMTDSSGMFHFVVNQEGWYAVYALKDDLETPGMDCVPSLWRFFLQFGTTASYTFVLERGASLYLDEEIWSLESNRAADYFLFTVTRPDGTALDTRSIREYGSGSDSYSGLGLDPSLVVVPANTPVAIRVYARVGSQTSYTFSAKGRHGYFELPKGGALHIDVREHSVSFAINVVREKLDSAFSLQKDAQDAGFLVTVERQDILRSYSLVDESLLELNRGSYDESFAKLRKAYILATESTETLEGLLQVGSQSALYLLFIFLFVASALAYLIIERERSLEIVIDGEKKISFSLNLLTAMLLYALLVAFFYASFPGCRLIRYEIFISTGIITFIMGQSIVVVAPRSLSEKKSEKRSIQFQSAVIAAFSMATRNLRKRKFRTVLCLVEMMILVFGFTTFTSISPGYGLVSRVLPPAHPVDAILIKDKLGELADSSLPFTPLPEAFIKWLENQPNVTSISLKAENVPRIHTKPLGYLCTTEGDMITLKGIMGIMPTIEAKITRLNETVVRGDYLQDDDLRGILVSSSLCERLGINVGDKLYGFGQEFVVRGFFDSKALVSFKDISDEPMIPYYLLSDPLSGELFPVSCLGDEVAMVTYNRSLTLPGVFTSRVLIQLKNPEDYSVFAEVVAFNREYSVFISHSGSLQLKYLGSFLEEKGMIIIPFLMLLVALNIAASMLGSVKERRSEIATLSSVGLNPTHIAALFVAEAAILGFIGGGLGFLSGISGYRLASVPLLGALQVREKASAEWGIIALFLSGFTAIVASLIPALRASTIVTPSLLRKWKPSIEGEKSERGDQPWVLDMPVRLRPRELESFVGFILSRLRGDEALSTHLIKDTVLEEEETVNGPQAKIGFRAYLDERAKWSRNEIVISREEGSEHFKAKLLCYPYQDFDRTIAKAGTLVRKLILEWEALTFEVATPFDTSLSQLYTLINAYTPTTLYLLTTELDISEKMESLERRLISEGLRPPRIAVSLVEPTDVDKCMKIAEEIVSRVDVVCISGESSAISTTLALNALKQKKIMCYVVDARPIGERLKNPFENLKIVTVT